MGGRLSGGTKELEQVLDGRPDHGDALPALIRVELWSGNALQARSWRATRSSATGRHHAAVSPPTGRSARCGATATRSPTSNAHCASTGRTWHATCATRSSTAGACGRRASIRQAARALERDLRQPEARQCSTAPVLVKYWDAVRFDTHSRISSRSRPIRGIRPGTYLFLQAGFSPDAGLYPSYRAAGDVYQALPWSFERRLATAGSASMPGRHLHRGARQVPRLALLEPGSDQLGTSGCSSGAAEGNDWRPRNGTGAHHPGRG